MHSLWRCKLGDWSVDVGFEGTAASINAGVFNCCAGCIADTRLDLAFLGLVSTGIKFWAATSQLLQSESDLM